MKKVKTKTKAKSSAAITQQVVSLLQQHKFAEVTSLLKDANLSNPAMMDALYSSGVHLINVGAYDDAACYFATLCNADAMVKGSEAHKQSLHGLLNSYRGLEDDVKIKQAVDALLTHSDLRDDTFVSVYTALARLCMWEQAHDMLPRVMDIVLQHRLGYKGTPFELLLNLLERPGIDGAMVYQAHCEAAKFLAKKTPVKPLQIQPVQRHKKVRIAYLSADFYRHVIRLFMQDILKGHDRTRFEVYCIANVAEPDDMTEYLKSLADHWIDIRADSDAEAAKKIADAEIDILIELGGYTRDSRLEMLRYKPAPVQMSYLGYPATTGMPEVDYKITDEASDPAGSERFYIEKLLRVPNGFLCRTEFMRNQADRSEPPCLSNGYITFGSFNNVRKLNPLVISWWAKILTQVEHSRLLIKSANLGAMQQQAFRDEFAKHGVDATRIDFYSYVSTYEEHVKILSRVDIALDAFPYNGTTTTCETLDVGIPVITLAGETHVQRASYSIMKQIGFDATVAFSEQEYIAKAAGQAANAPGLAILRQVLPMLIANASIAQPAVFMPQFEDILLSAWHEKTGVAWDFHKD